MSMPSWMWISQEQLPWGGGARGQVCKGGDPGFGSPGGAVRPCLCPGLLLPKPVFSTGFVLLPWELSIRECWVGWAGRPGQADGRARADQCQAFSRRGLSTPHSSTAHPAGPGPRTAEGRVSAL